MRKGSIPGKSDLEAIRDQILNFACGAHDFRAETDKFLHNGGWYGEFVVTLRDQPEDERLYCEAPSGEHFIRFWLDLEVDAELWERELENILQMTSHYDVAIVPAPIKVEGGRRRCRLHTRAWIPNFSQRIFGLTLSNLMACQDAVTGMFSDAPGGHVRS